MRFMFIAVVNLFIQMKETIAISTTEDREFLISTPSTSIVHNAFRSYPRLYLSMISVLDNKVVIITKHITSLDVFVNKTVQLRSKERYTFFKNYAHFGMDVVSGKRWTYHLIGESFFSLMVIMMDDELTMETLTALPVAGWGKRYTVATLWSQISIVLINYKDANTISVNLKSNNTAFRVKIGRAYFQGGNKTYIALTAYQSYAISTCHQIDAEGAASGTFFEGTGLFGLISGHCKASTFTQSCDKQDNNIYKAFAGRLVADMLPPVETFGRFFALFRLPLMKATGLYVVVSTEDSCDVKISNKTNTANFQLASAGDSNAIEALNGVLECSLPCLVVFYQNSSCISNEQSGAAGVTMATMTPIELFYFVYMVMVPDIEMQHYLLIVVSQTQEYNIFTLMRSHAGDDDPINGSVDDSIKVIFTQTYWGQFEVYPYIIKKNSRLIHFSMMARFGCYLYGFNKKSTYMHSAGVVSSNINKKYCVNSGDSMFPDDLVDNDCDGKVDEEELNNSDDDNDGSTDEDNRHFHKGKEIGELEFLETYYKHHHPSNFVRKTKNFTLDTELPKDAPPAHEEHDETTTTRRTTTMRKTQKTPKRSTKPPYGIETKRPLTSTKAPMRDTASLQTWTIWHCSFDCKNTSQFRERFCKENRPDCRQPLIESRTSTCYVGKTCPKDCKDYKWDTGCLMSCVNCELPCNKFLGNCSSCKPGFKEPKQACSKPCGPDRYGRNCNGLCMEKCGEDCIERVNGECPGKNTAFYIAAILATLVFPIGVIVYFLMQRRTKASLEAADSGDFQTKSTASKSEASAKSGKSEKSAKDSHFSSSADSET